LRLAETAGCVLPELSKSAMATNQAPKLARLIVREPPGLPGLAIFDHDTSLVAGDDLKRAGRERNSHCAPSMFAKLRPARGAVASVMQRSPRRTFDGLGSAAVTHLLRGRHSP